MAEHHSSDGLAGTAPEILIAGIAGVTARLRVGSGGVMLSHYSPLKVAESFRVLEALHPGRIDLGIGRAPGSDQRTARALEHGPGALGIEQFPNQIGDLIDYLGDGLPMGHRFAGVKAMPSGPTRPELWLLGSSGQSAAYAAHFGAAFSFAHFINDDGGPEIMDAYRRSFRPSAHLADPQGSIGVFVLVADTEAEAQRLAASRDLWRLRLDRGMLGAIPSPETALAYVYSPQEQTRVTYHRRRQVIGAPEQVRDRLIALADAYGVDEVVVVSICFDHAARLRSYALLAEAFGMAGAALRARETVSA